jgi:hypothetical protein
MAGVAVDGSNITEVKKTGHVTYISQRYEVVQYGACNSWDPITGMCNGWDPDEYDWVTKGSHSTDAKITGTVSCSSKIKVNGTSVAKVGDTVNFTWVADPPVPSDAYPWRYRNVSPATSGSGTGVITGGSVKGKLGGQSIALIGSEVEVLGVTTTVADGNTKINFSS